MDQASSMLRSALLSLRSTCLFIAHVAPLYNSKSNPEKALCESRFHLIVTRYFCLLFCIRFCPHVYEYIKPPLRRLSGYFSVDFITYVY